MISKKFLITALLSAGIFSSCFSLFSMERTNEPAAISTTPAPMLATADDSKLWTYTFSFQEGRGYRVSKYQTTNTRDSEGNWIGRVTLSLQDGAYELVVMRDRYTVKIPGITGEKSFAITPPIKKGAIGFSPLPYAVNLTIKK